MTTWLYRITLDALHGRVGCVDPLSVLDLIQLTWGPTCSLFVVFSMTKF